MNQLEKYLAYVTIEKNKEISEDLASLLAAKGNGNGNGKGKKPTLSLCFTYDAEARTYTKPFWQLTQTLATASFTYEEANKCLGMSKEMQILSDCATLVSHETLADSHEWVEKMMIFYNKHAGELLASHKVGILRRHSEAKAEAIKGIEGSEGSECSEGSPEFLAYLSLFRGEAAEYCLTTSENTRHYGLDSEFYAYASSPIRRYADLVNQRAIKDILQGRPTPTISQLLIDELNRRQKQAKAFSRDLFFLTNLSLPSCESVNGIVLSQEINASAKTKTKIWVPEWKRQITSKTLEGQSIPLQRGTQVSIQWYECRQEARWKDRIVFKVSRLDELQC